MTDRPRKPAAERKEEIEEATIGLLDQLGPDRLTTQQVAKAVGVSQAAIFRHFPTKDALWEAVLGRIRARALAAWERADGAAPGVAALRRLIGAQLALIQGTPALPSLLFSRTVHGEGAFPRSVILGVMGLFTARLERQIAHAQQSGAMRQDVAPADAALLLIGLIQGLVLRWSLAGRGFDLEAEGQRLLDVQLRCLDAKDQP